LTEGVRIRATERLTGIHRDTIMRLGVRVGEGCAVLHDAMMRGLHVGRIELDEAWSYVAKKQRHLKSADPADFDDQYVFLALAGAGKAIISWLVGKRNGDTAPSSQISAPAFSARPRYPRTPSWLIPMRSNKPSASNAASAPLRKHYAVDAAVEAARRYFLAAVVSVSRRRIIGAQRMISTSFIERQNLTLRMQQRRFTRLTNAFRKKLENHVSAVALYIAHYNPCRIHETLRITPAMQLGVTDHVWTIGELVDATLDGVVPAPGGRRYGRFAVIDGDRE
jgi:hypothetical protein